MIYGDFAQIYDKLMYDFDYDLVYKTINNIYKDKSLDINNILELACGTGTLTKKLSNQYNIDALDISEDMLAIAQNKIGLNKNVKLFRQDMKSLNMGKKYDSVLCICDSLNYILEEKDIKEIFKKVYNHLEEDGIFIFDLNMEKKFLDMEEIYIDETKDVFYVWENYFDKDTKTNTYGVNFFISKDDENKKYERVYEEHVEKAYNIDFIKESLEEAGFKSIEFFDDYDLFKYSKETYRIVVIAGRK